MIKLKKNPFQKQWFDAAISGDIATLKTLINIKNYDFIHLTTKRLRRTALHYTSEQGHDNCVEFLIKKGALIDDQDQNGQTPLHLACKEGHLVTFKYLIKTGASIHLQCHHGYNPLHLAAYNGHQELVKLLIEFDANLNIYNNYKKTALSLCYERGFNHISELLIQNGCLVTEEDLKLFPDSLKVWYEKWLLLKKLNLN